jgi:hypothetical protein
MNKDMKDLIVLFLEELLDRFANDGCNDLIIDNTEFNKQMCLSYDSDQEEDIEWFSEINDGKQLSTHNTIVIDNLIEEIMNLT